MSCLRILGDKKYICIATGTYYYYNISNSGEFVFLLKIPTKEKVWFRNTKFMIKEIIQI